MLLPRVVSDVKNSKDLRQKSKENSLYFSLLSNVGLREKLVAKVLFLCFFVVVFS